jgi:transcriptional regulator with XRE-family HTH domain
MTPAEHEFNVRLGQRVRELRLRCGFSVKGFAILAGVGESWLRNIEKGGQGMRVSDLVKLATAGRIKVDLLPSKEPLHPFGAGDRARRRSIGLCENPACGRLLGHEGECARTHPPQPRERKGEDRAGGRAA